MLKTVTQLSLFETPIRLSTVSAKPFLKWAGGKTQLLPQLSAFFPAGLKTGQIATYVEPFVGSGAVFFHIAQHYPVKNFILSDSNRDLVLAYITIQQQTESLIDYLCALEKTYHKLSSDAQKDFFYTVRQNFNQSRHSVNPHTPNVERTAQLIFLNRTCFNGLYRVNAKGGFNVPFGSYKNPKICFRQNLRNIAAILHNVTILHGDFETCRPFFTPDTFAYFDPPYRPISKTASFTAYQKSPFNDRSQIRLAQFFREMDTIGAKLMLSNSDPHNTDPTDDFFDNLYADFHIHRVSANRMINRDGNKRGKITEILVTNYE